MSGKKSGKSQGILRWMISGNPGKSTCDAFIFSYVSHWSSTLRLDFTPNLVHRLAFGTPKFYIAPYGKINHRLFNLDYNCDVKSGLN